MDQTQERRLIGSLALALEQVANGELKFMAAVQSADQADLGKAAASLPHTLILTGAATAAVLGDLLDGSCAWQDAQAWAFFVRRGYVPSWRSPILPIAVDYEDFYEDAIVEAVSRMDELGDEVDGHISEAEGRLLLQLLGVP
ncbi:hypothetical protein [Phycicoccus sp. Soil802]|uniref:hypothetical protein n=1 Tax=Phycicoccus sp. Soil802 TaxID=1736414 RepID=UPI000702B575|nr:hypothetical protein [Phycicoccus sp. Soil802]KRF27245.1 hypothetical protein ASG91_12245 [Phycicoccus sp. Soil802]